MERSEALAYLKGLKIKTKSKYKAIDRCMKDMGLNKVRSASGKIYYE